MEIEYPESFRPKGSNTGNFLRAEFGVSRKHVLVSEDSDSAPYIFKERGKLQLRVGKGWLRIFFPPDYRARVKLLQCRIPLSHAEVEYFYAMKKAFAREMDRADSDPRSKTL